MKKFADKLFKNILCILLIINLCGCWNRRELDTLGIVMGVGVDKSNEPGQIELIAQFVKPGQIKSTGKEGGSASEAFWNVSATGDTVFSSIRSLTRKSSRKLFFPHNQVIIFDKSIAEDGIEKYIDFFTRDPETRMNVFVLISECKSIEVLNLKSELEKIPANNISKLIKVESTALSQTREIMLRDLVAPLMSKTMAETIPLINISRNGGDKTAVVISETAVLKDGKLIGKLDKHEGRGLMWMLGKVKSTIIEVEDSNNDKVSLESIRSKGKMVPEIKDNKITIKINIFEEGNVGEQTGNENLSKLTEFASLEKNKSDLIKSEVLAAVTKAKELNADVFGFGEAIHKKYPKQWKDLEGNWDEIFKDIQVEVNVTAKLRLMGRTVLPAMPIKEKQ